MTGADPAGRREIVALIPARGGSKGIPGKNLRTFAGRPLVAWTVAAAREAPSVTRVVVSTDDEEIAAAARQAGAGVVERPAELAGDEASSESALLHALDHLRDGQGYEPDLVAFLQATSPLRPPGLVEAAIGTFDRAGADSLFSAGPLEGFVWRETDGELRPLTYDPAARPRRQEIGRDLVENGSLYLFRPEVLRRCGHRLGGTIAVHVMDPLDSFQVDEPGDLERLERLAEIRRPTTPDLTPEELAGIELLVLDFDGVMTDNRVTVHQNGSEAVTCHRGDGFGIGLLLAAGVRVQVLSKERNPVVATRCDKLRIPHVHGLDDKLGRLRELARELSLNPRQIAYVGNDVNDVEVMGWVGLPVAVADAEPPARAAARWVTRHPGGRGAVREVCDALCAVRAKRTAHDQPSVPPAPERTKP